MVFYYQREEDSEFVMVMVFECCMLHATALLRQTDEHSARRRTDHGTESTEPANGMLHAPVARCSYSSTRSTTYAVLCLRRRGMKG